MCVSKKSKIQGPGRDKGRGREPKLNSNCSRYVCTYPYLQYPPLSTLVNRLRASLEGASLQLFLQYIVVH